MTEPGIAGPGDGGLSFLSFVVSGAAQSKMACSAYVCIGPLRSLVLQVCRLEGGRGSRRTSKEQRAQFTLPSIRLFLFE